MDENAKLIRQVLDRHGQHAHDAAVALAKKAATDATANDEIRALLKSLDRFGPGSN